MPGDVVPTAPPNHVVPVVVCKIQRAIATAMITVPGSFVACGAYGGSCLLSTAVPRGLRGRVKAERTTFPGGVEEFILAEQCVYFSGKAHCELNECGLLIGVLCTYVFWVLIKLGRARNSVPSRPGP